jgi:phospholipid/cholesterol/gamma-HCH transport system substrate-binding protein
MPSESERSPVGDSLVGKRRVTLSIISVGLAVLVGFTFLKISTTPRFRLTTCFQDVSGLRAGARVRVAGVEVGTVRDVRAQPTDKACPGAVEIVLRAPYDLKLPNDSVASINTEGLLGQAYLAIDASGASGPPVLNGGKLPSRESANFTALTLDRALKVVDERLKQLSDRKESCNPASARTQSNADSSHKPPSSVPK